MPSKIGAGILRLPGYGVHAWEADEAANPLTLSIRNRVSVQGEHPDP
jgi:hypothetical protein